MARTPAAECEKLISPKVAHITTVGMTLRYGLLSQLRSISDAGYEAVGISSPGPDIPPVEEAGIRHIPIPMTRRITPLADLFSFCRLYKTMRKERFAIVHTHNPKPGILGQLAARLSGVPVVVNTVHGYYFHERTHFALRRLYVSIERMAARCSDVILSQSREDIDTALRERICAPEKIRNLGNGIDVDRFDRRKVDPNGLAAKRDKLGLPTSVPVVGFVGRLVAEKGLRELMGAARKVLSVSPRVRFLFVGPTDQEKSDSLTPDIAEEYGVSTACIFTGRREDMADLYAMMDVFVLPSHREGLPRAPMEASAMMVPCVVTNIRGCREVVEHGRNGLLVPVGDVDALANAIVELLNDKEKARNMGEEGRRIALERFDERRVFETVIAEYGRLLRAKGLCVPERMQY